MEKMFFIDITWQHKKTRGFLCFQGAIERRHWTCDQRVKHNGVSYFKCQVTKLKSTIEKCSFEGTFEFTTSIMSFTTKVIF